MTDGDDGMYSRNRKRNWITREENQLIDGICLNSRYQSEEFRDRLYLLIEATVSEEYKGAVFHAMLSRDTLTATAIKFNVSEGLLSKLIKDVKKKWGEAFAGWRFMPPEGGKRADGSSWKKSEACAWTKDKRKNQLC